ncbi:uncharacterized protein F5891DRAFT_978257 [Suillus fuscotomentosus]|uniref:Uncharacterized protein n=1 Tax=Suillus fuscotomentosus TaxID=1912939 RepID=A0AAD4ED19_9AGAM|nr:uncharacterized protein F5891DRAFT_978257 [Suillus fuscotomentosus]KAG1902764.1 hypothetical protein F5891DRAFT_978257 [Suillus fuscotomentosus]
MTYEIGDTHKVELVEESDGGSEKGGEGEKSRRERKVGREKFGPNNFHVTLPPKVKAKCKVMESHITAVTGQGKKACAAYKAGLVLSLGAGTGNAQLEKVGAVPEARTWTNLLKGSTTLAPNISANPLAPESHQKGHGCPSYFRQYRLCCWIM